MSGTPKSTIAIQNQLVQWINEAGMSDGPKKSKVLRKILEVILHQASQMLPVYMENILSYVSDKSTDVKKQVVAFIEEISKLHPHLLPKAIGQMTLLLNDVVVAVQKRAIQASSIIYRNALIWICKNAGDKTDMQFVWEQLSEIKLLILNMIDSENEGIRTHSIKFLEEVVLLQTSSDITADDEFNLDNLPANLLFIKRRALEEESEHIFQLLIKFHNSQHISSVNLMACMTTLCLLAKFRPKYMPRVIQALGDLHTTLPPTLSQSQVNSVRKHLKMLLVNLIKHPSSNEMLPQLTQLLLDIGVTNQEINKIVPKERRNKRLGDIKNSETPAKRFRVDSPQSNSQGSDSNSRTDFNMFDEDSSSQSAIKPPLPKIETVETKVVTEEVLLNSLNNLDFVVGLVTKTLVNNLPDVMPENFIRTYKPIPNAGSFLQKQSLARLMVALFKGEEEKKEPTRSLSDIAAKIPLLREEDDNNTLRNAVAKLQQAKTDRQIESAVSKLMEETRQEHLKEEERRAKESDKQKEKEKEKPPPTPTIPKLKQKVKLLKLQEITRPIPKEIKEKLMIGAVKRILNAEMDATIGGAAQIRAKFITIFASSYTPEIREVVLNYILEDPANRIDIALQWLYEEFAYMQGFNRHPVTLHPKTNEKHDQNYNQLLCSLITQICERGDAATESNKDVLLRKIYLESPLITEEAVDYLRHLVTEDRVTYLALDLLEDLCTYRSPKAHKYVPSLLCHTLNENDEIRDIALKSAVKIFKTGSDTVKKTIVKQALMYLSFISMPHPPIELVHSRTAGRLLGWNDQLYKLCLNLIMALYPENEDLLMDVAEVYGVSSPEAKRCILRACEGPIRASLKEADGELTPAVRELLEKCPKGAETLLTRLLHIMTENAPPSQELAARVRELYATRVSDVRFLIPVLNGLSKKEILAALPKLIKLNPVVVKEVFNKLLGLQNPKEKEENLPVSPAELLVALHLIDPHKADLKYTIKATALCFAEKQTYTQEVLSLVLEELVEQPEIPVLLMRTVLQALTLYPSLQPLVLDILQRLVEREVWNNKVSWEGWIKCVERSLPTSRFLLANLPPPALPSIMGHPLLSKELKNYVSSCTQQQLAQIPSHILVAWQEQQKPAPYPSMMQPPQPVPPPNPLEPLPPGME